MTPLETLRYCVQESGGDFAAAVLACDYILSTELQLENIKLSISEDEYPRDKANRFLDKYSIIKAANDHIALGKLKDSIAEHEHNKLDILILNLQSGGTIHHPKEPSGLGINIKGEIEDPRWKEYAQALDLHDAWEERNSSRTSRTKATKQLTRVIRKREIDNNLVDSLLLQGGATSAEIRSVTRMRHKIKQEREEQSSLDELYEEIVEDIFFRIESEEEYDKEPPLPVEPDSNSTPTVMLGMVDGEWRGRNPPGGIENWAPSTPGPRGGKRWKPKNSQAVKDGENATESTKPIARSDKGTGTGSVGGTGTEDDVRSETDSGAVETEAQEPSDTTTVQDGKDTNTVDSFKTTRDPLAKYSPEQRNSIANVNKGIDNYARHFRKIGQKEIADWFLEMKEHINNVGIDSALEMMGEDKSKTNPLSKNLDPSERVQYKGTAYFGEGFENEYDFLKEYLDNNGIVLQTTSIPDPKLRTIASAPVLDSIKYAKKGDVIARATNIQTKLEESRLLPGLESSEDIHKLVGREVTQFTPDVIKKFDDTYGKGKWLVKPYGDEAYAGFGVFFPQRIKEIQKSSKKTLYDCDSKLKSKGYTLYRDETGTVVGIKNTKTKEAYKFGTSEIRSLPDKKVKKIAAVAAASAPQEKGTRLPLSPEDSLRQDYGILIQRSDDGKKVVGVTDEDGHYIAVDSEEWKTYGEYDSFGQVLERAITSIESGEKGDNRFMVQPAFEAIGVSEMDRALGSTWETSTEGRVHVSTVDGKASVVPYSTLASRHDAFPVVFKSPDILAMEKAVQDTIDALPESERAGQVYSPDVMKTKDGWRVLELNAAVEGGQSLWLEENPFVIDSYVSMITGREPSHAKFMRELLQGKVDELRPKKKSSGDTSNNPKSDDPTKDNTDKGGFKNRLFGGKSTDPNKPTPTSKLSGKSSAFSVNDQEREPAGSSKGGQFKRRYFHGSPNSKLTTLKKGSYIAPNRGDAVLMGRFHKDSGKTWDDEDLVEPHFFGKKPKWKPDREPMGIPTIYELELPDEHIDFLDNPYEHIIKVEAPVKIHKIRKKRKLRGKSSAFSTDEHGLEHAPAGSGKGGQFVKKGSGNGDSSKSNHKSEKSKDTDSPNTSSTKSNNDSLGIGDTLIGLTAKNVVKTLNDVGDNLGNRLPFGLRHAYKARQTVRSAIWTASNAIAGSAAKKRGIEAAKKRGMTDSNEIEDYAEKYKTRTINTLTTIGSVTSTGLGVAGLVSLIGPGNVAAAGTAVATLAGKGITAAITAIGSGGAVAKAAVSAYESTPLVLKLSAVPLLPVAYLMYSGVRNPVSTIKAATETLNTAIENVKDKLRSNLEEDQK